MDISVIRNNSEVKFRGLDMHKFDADREDLRPYLNNVETEILRACSSKENVVTVAVSNDLGEVVATIMIDLSGTLIGIPILVHLPYSNSDICDIGGVITLKEVCSIVSNMLRLIVDSALLLSRDFVKRG